MLNFYQPLSQFEATLYSNTVITFIDFNFFLYFYYFLNSFYSLNIQEFFNFWGFYEIYLKYCVNISILSYLYELLCLTSEILLYCLICFIDIFFIGIISKLTIHDIQNKEIEYVKEIWFDASINKFYTTTFFIICYFLIFLVFCFKQFKFYKISWNIIIFSFFEEFLSTTIIQQLGIKRGQKYSVFLKSFFFLILFSNIFGLIPFSFTITSHLIFTFSLSLSILLGITFLGFYMQGFSFLNLLVPGGAPAFLLPLLVPIEFISYVARCFSLAIRLFANMMSGHTLLNILSGFILKIGQNGFLFLSLAPLFVVMAVSVLEVGIAFLQAYVFLVLVCIYLKDAFEAAH
jgi:ATP synthase subunit 6